MPVTIAGRKAAEYALLAVLTAGCGSDVDVESSNRGSGSDSQATTVTNAYIVPTFVPGSCALQIGDVATMRFTITNNRTVKTERLLAVSTNAAERVSLPAAATHPIPSAGTLAVGRASNDTSAAATVAAVTLDGLRRNVHPAMSVPVTFTFNEAGQITVQVPVEACPTQQ